MGAVTIGLLHPGEMGTAIASALVGSGHRVCWSSRGRSDATRSRADAAGLVDTGTVDALIEECDVVLSVCPPHAATAVAEEVAAAVGGKQAWWYVDANAVAPGTARRIEATVEAAGARFVDGGLVGPPPVRPGTTRLYLSGAGAPDLSELLASPLWEIHVLDERTGSASALKLAYAAWTKGSAALLLSARAAAERSGVGAALLEEWRTSQPGLLDRWQAARNSADAKGWRWSGEMREISAMFGALGLPAEFHAAAAQVFDDPTTVA